MLAASSDETRAVILAVLFGVLMAQGTKQTMYKTRDKKDTAFPRCRMATRLIAKPCLWLALLLVNQLPAAAGLYLRTWLIVGDN